MNQAYTPKEHFSADFLDKTAYFILKTQRADGSIPWFEGGMIDPWDHIEAAMGLAVCGHIDAARRAYDWLKHHQNPNGGWYASYYPDPSKNDLRTETNFVAYSATGIWHLYLITKDLEMLSDYWPMISRAMDLVISLQGDYGEIFWSIDPEKGIQRDALVTGCSSIYHSLGSAIKIAKALGQPTESLQETHTALGIALTRHPEAFDRTWESKARFSMDWFYPVLSGAIKGDAAINHINERWDQFIVDQLGCRCVNDEPWVTIAETCELVMALIAIGDHSRASEIYGWIHQFRDTDGAYWTGYVYPDQAIWPEEKTTWTAGAVLLAADALTHKTDAHSLFSEDSPANA
ncbi:MAG: hypothetical protein ACPHF3_02265 [Pseudomonadales bacterium]